MIGELGEHGQVAAGGLGPLVRRDDPLDVAVEVADHGVDLAERHPDAGHRAQGTRLGGFAGRLAGWLCRARYRCCVSWPSARRTRRGCGLRSSAGARRSRGRWIGSGTTRAWPADRWRCSPPAAASACSSPPTPSRSARWPIPPAGPRSRTSQRRSTTSPAGRATSSSASPRWTSPARTGSRRRSLRSRPWPATSWPPRIGASPGRSRRRTPAGSPSSAWASSAASSSTTRATSTCCWWARVTRWRSTGQAASSSSSPVGASGSTSACAPRDATARSCAAWPPTRRTGPGGPTRGSARPC